MSALMMVFLFISVSYSYQVNKQSETLVEQSRQLAEQNTHISQIVSEWEDYRALIHSDLEDEFGEQLYDWNAEIDEETLSIRFNKPSLLFRAGRADISPEFDVILRDFWPRYISVMVQYQSVIREVRIEGHTSSEWGTATLDESYFRNMALSQSRTRAALEKCYLYTPQPVIEWVRQNVTANGMSFSRTISNADGSENPGLSRRVEFTVVIDSHKKLKEISEEL
jgi:outer membrane protein OmpA-like peptidoglycan-associated protein